MAALHPTLAEEQQARAAAVLDICIQRHYLAAKDAARLWASSRALQQLVSSRLSSALLLRSVAATAQAAAAGEDMHALRWLLRQPAVTPAMINQCSQQLLAIPGVPLAAAEALVGAGLQVQVTGQQLVAAAYKCFDWLGVWVQAVSAAGVPLEEWAADLPAELRQMCCWRLYGGLTREVIDQLLQDLTPARTADLLAVVFNMAGCGPPGSHLSDAEVMIPRLFLPPTSDAMAQLPAAAVEALLRLAVQVQGRTTNSIMVDYLPITISQLAELPAAAQLPTAVLVELTQWAVQLTGPGRLLLATSLLQLLAGRELTAEQLETLLSLLQGPAAAAAAAASKAYQSWRVPDGRSVMAWLASQPGAAAAAARLGLTAADVRDRAAAALLFGGQQEAAAGTAGGSASSGSGSSDPSDSSDDSDSSSDDSESSDRSLPETSDG
uniref:Uncharacterized protein n=1 Tax=Tetradesmus obliquus TaxID=3088 RepID=A0A383W0H1_TETOB|eukprot:jgi/Sobl393_1/3986/SZX71198.1